MAFILQNILYLTEGYFMRTLALMCAFLSLNSFANSHETEFLLKKYKCSDQRAHVKTTFASHKVNYNDKSSFYGVSKENELLLVNISDGYQNIIYFSCEKKLPKKPDIKLIDDIIYGHSDECFMDQIKQGSLLIGRRYVQFYPIKEKLRTLRCQS